MSSDDSISDYEELFKKRDDKEIGLPSKRPRRTSGCGDSYYLSPWMCMLNDPAVEDPTTLVGKKFRRRFR